MKVETLNTAQELETLNLTGQHPATRPAGPGYHQSLTDPLPHADRSSRPGSVLCPDVTEKWGELRSLPQRGEKDAPRVCGLGLEGRCGLPRCMGSPTAPSPEVRDRYPLSCCLSLPGRGPGLALPTRYLGHLDLSWAGRGGTGQ